MLCAPTQCFLLVPTKSLSSLSYPFANISFRELRACAKFWVLDCSAQPQDGEESCKLWRTPPEDTSSSFSYPILSLAFLLQGLPARGCVGGAGPSRHRHLSASNSFHKGSA